jgi:hypothetical protein
LAEIAVGFLGMGLFPLCSDPKVHLGPAPVPKAAPVHWRREVENLRKREKNMSGRAKVLTLLLGVWMFMFGFLKFFQPISGWFDVQIQQSHLPHEAILAGKVTEMIVGVLFLLPWLWRSLTIRSKDQVLLVACFILFIQMFVAIYVHLQPGVPPNVLPFGIKSPVVPVVVLLLGLLTAFDVGKQLRTEKA